MFCLDLMPVLKQLSRLASSCRWWRDVLDRMGGPSLEWLDLCWDGEWARTEGPRMENGTPPFSLPYLLTQPAYLWNPSPKYEPIKKGLFDPL